MSIELIQEFNKRQAKSYSRKIGQEFSGETQSLLSQEPFAIRAQPSIKHLRSGVNLTTVSYDLPSGSFTNSYDLAFASDDQSLAVRVDSKPRLYSIRRMLVNDRTVIASINGGFFFLVDSAQFQPSEYSYNLCVRDEKVVSLPSADRPAVITKDGKIDVVELRATGNLRIGNSSVDWLGKNSDSANPLNNTTVLYNSACCEVQHIPSDRTGQARVLVAENNFTPQTRDGFDLIINNDENGLVVSALNPGGNTNYFAGAFVLQIQNQDPSKYKPGDRVHAENIDSIPLKGIDSAITIGPSIKHFLNNKDHPINRDVSLGSHPPFQEKPLARSIIYKTLDGIIHFRVFDGAPRTEFFKGVTPGWLAHNIPVSDAEWMYSLDPGQSARLVTREEGGVSSYGNSHYMRWPKSENTTFLWSAANGRLVPSSISLCQV